MPGGADVTRFMDGCGGLSHVVAQHRQPHDEVLGGISGPAFGVGIHAQQGMVPHVPFGVPMRVLIATDQRFEFGKVANPPAIAEEVQSKRGTDPFQDELAEFSEDAFARKVVRFHRC